MDDRRRAFKGKAPFNPNNHLPTFSQTPNPPSLPNPPQPKVRFKHLPPEEIVARHEKGLYYNCDDKWSSSHKCKGRFFLLIVDEDDDLDPPFDLTLEDIPIVPPSDAQISLNALSGLLAPETFRLLGSLGHSQVTILIDGGSTHNFVQARLVKFLNLTTKPTSTLKVMIGDGNVLDFCQVCPNITVSIQGQTFHVNLHVLPISGADLVLGVQWLKDLGPIVTEYGQLTMQFYRAGQLIEFPADAPSNPNPTSSQQIKRYLQTLSLCLLPSPHTT